MSDTDAKPDPDARPDARRCVCEPARGLIPPGAPLKYCPVHGAYLSAPRIKPGLWSFGS